ncbi:MAG TPA: DUF4191 domain-containing protein [Actinomycetales bacterium]|nr:DUF4191 domain-containing protein [Actinomycetales bacterium]
MAKTDAEDVAPKPKKQKKRRWYHNFADAFRLVARHEKWAPWAIFGSILGMIGLGVLLGSLAGMPIYGGFMGLLLGTLVALIILSWRTRKVSYRQIEGQPGAAFAVLDQIKRGWSIEQEPVQVNPRTQDLVFRMVGRPGVVLVSEGPSTRVARLLGDERRRIQRVVPQNVPIHFVEVGNGEGQVPLDKLERRVKGMKKTLTAQEVSAVANRLRSLGTMKLPIPKGIDPMRARPDRRGMRGR